MCLTSQVHKSGTINDVKTAQGMLEHNSSSTLSDFYIYFILNHFLTTIPFLR